MKSKNDELRSHYNWLNRVNYGRNSTHQKAQFLQLLKYFHCLIPLITVIIHLVINPFICLFISLSWFYLVMACGRPLQRLSNYLINSISCLSSCVFFLWSVELLTNRWIELIKSFSLIFKRQPLTHWREKFN